MKTRFLLLSLLLASGPIVRAQEVGFPREIQAPEPGPPEAHLGGASQHQGEMRYR